MTAQEKELKFKTIYDEWAQALFRFIFFKSKDAKLSEDIVQDTFVKYWDKMETIGAGKDKSYLFATSKNLLLNHFEHQKVVKRHEESVTHNEESSSPHYDLEVSEFKERLENAINALPDKQREVFLMHRVEGFKYKEISDLLEVSQKAVEKRMSQALKSLRKLCSKI